MATAFTVLSVAFVRTVDIRVSGLGGSKTPLLDNGPTASRAGCRQLDSPLFKLPPGDELAAIRMSDVEAGAAVTLIGNNQVTGVFAVPLRHLLGYCHAGIWSLPITAIDSWIFPFADDRHRVPPV